MAFLQKQDNYNEAATFKLLVHKKLSLILTDLFATLCNNYRNREVIQCK